MSENYKIENNIPVMQFRRTGLFKVISQMQVGDSVVVKHTEKTTAYQAANRHRIKITMRKLPDGTYRLWRTA